MPRGNFSSMDDGTPLAIIQETVFEKKNNNRSHQNHQNHQNQQEHYNQQNNNYIQQQHNQQNNYMQPQQSHVQQQYQQQHNQQKFQDEEDEDEENYIEPISKPIEILKEEQNLDNVVKNMKNNIDSNKSKKFLQFLLYSIVFSFLIFVGFYSYPFIQGIQSKYTILENLKYSIGIGFILGAVISLLQNYLILS